MSLKLNSKLYRLGKKTATISEMQVNTFSIATICDPSSAPVEKFSFKTLKKLDERHSFKLTQIMILILFISCKNTQV